MTTLWLSVTETRCFKNGFNDESTSFDGVRKGGGTGGGDCTILERTAAISNTRRNTCTS